MYSMYCINNKKLQLIRLKAAKTFRFVFNFFFKSLSSELRRAFDAFVIKGRENEIHSKDLGNVLRSIGQNMSNLEILDMINELDEDGKINFTLTRCVSRLVK